MKEPRKDVKLRLKHGDEELKYEGPPRGLGPVCVMWISRKQILIPLFPVAAVIFHILMLFL